ncbi:MAG: hypothetical protein AAGA48_39090 [Myxococcota bacterium]
MGALRWDQGGEARDERHAREHHRMGAVGPGALQADLDRPVVAQSEPIVGQRGPPDVAAEAQVHPNSCATKSRASRAAHRDAVGARAAFEGGAPLDGPPPFVA